MTELNIEGGSAKKPDEKKSKEDQQNLADLNSAHCSSQAKCQYKPVTQIKLFLFAPCVQKPLRLVCTHDPLGKIHRYRPRARLIRAKYYMIITVDLG